MRKIFIDSSAFYALVDSSSKKGEQIELFISQNRPQLMTTDFVFAETLSLVTKRQGKHIGTKLGNMILASKLIKVYYVSEKWQKEAWNIYSKYQDKDFDLIDAISFIFCNKHKIKQVLTLDHHFTQMGYEMVP